MWSNHPSSTGSPATTTTPSARIQEGIRITAADEDDDDGGDSTAVDNTAHSSSLIVVVFVVITVLVPILAVSVSLFLLPVILVLVPGVVSEVATAALISIVWIGGAIKRTDSALTRRKEYFSRGESGKHSTEPKNSKRKKKRNRRVEEDKKKRKRTRTPRMNLYKDRKVTKFKP